MIALAAALATALWSTPLARAGVANPHNVEACVTCHASTPRFGVDSRSTVTYRGSGDDPALCTGCHPGAMALHPVGEAAGSGPAGARASRYLPAGTGERAGKIVCTTCHFIHAADGRFALLRGFPGSPDPRYFPSWADFCRECHGGNLAGRSAHRGGEEACRFCHQSQPGQGRGPEVVSVGRDLCELCHAGMHESHYRDAAPLERGRACDGCHDAHAASDVRPGLLSEDFVAAAVEEPRVRPHYRKGLCLACHADLDSYELRGEGISATCDRCHASGLIPANIHPLRPVPERMTPPKGWPLEGGALTCLTCHEQGHDDQEPTPKMLRGGPYASAREVCRRCHGEFDLRSSTIHRDINEGRRCEFCHVGTPVVGRDRSDTVKLLAPPDLLCMRCHDVAASPSNHHRYFARGGVVVGRVPDFLPLSDGRITCTTCHNPHQLEASNYRLRGGVGESALCLECHRQ